MEFVNYFHTCYEQVQGQGDKIKKSQHRVCRYTFSESINALDYTLRPAFKTFILSITGSCGPSAKSVALNNGRTVISTCAALENTRSALVINNSSSEVEVSKEKIQHHVCW